MSASEHDVLSVVRPQLLPRDMGDDNAGLISVDNAEDELRQAELESNVSDS